MISDLYKKDVVVEDKASVSIVWYVVLVVVGMYGLVLDGADLVIGAIK